MVPDKGFTRQLKKLDKEFDVVWDWGAGKWEIWKFPKNGQEPYHVTTVQTKNRSYRELGQDLLLNLQQSITWSQTMTAGQICDYLDEMDNQVKRRKARDFTNVIESIARETFSYAQGILQIQVPKSLKIAEVVKNG